MLPFIEICLFGLGFLFLNLLGGDELFFVLIVVGALILQKSFEKFHLKDEVYRIVILGIIWFVNLII